MKKLLFVAVVAAMLPFGLRAQATYGKISPGGGLTASLGQELTFTYTALAGATYYWSAYPTVTTIPSSAIVFTTAVNTGTVKVKFTQPMIAMLCVTRYKEGTQPAMECISFQVVSCSAPPTPASITGPAAITNCGQYVFTSATVAGAVAYYWTGLVTGDKQTTEPSITLLGSDFKNGSNSLKVKAINNCGGSGNFKSKSVTSSAIASPTSIVGEDSVLLSQAPFTYTTPAITRAAAYRWEGFVTGQKTTPTPSVSVLAADLAEGLNTLSVRAIDSCDVVSTGSASMQVRALVLGNPTSISGPASIEFCSNATYTTQTVANAAQYVWSGLATGSRTTTQPQIVLQYVDFAPGARTLSVVAKDGSGNTSTSASLALNIPNAPLIGVPMQLPNTADYCSPLSFSIPAYPGATSYFWVIGGLTRSTNDPFVSFMPNEVSSGPGQNFTVSVMATSCVNSAPALITARMPDPILSAISGPSSINCGSTTYSITPVCGAQTYRWEVGSDVFNTPSNQITISGMDYSNGSLQIRVRVILNGGQSQQITRGINNSCIFGMQQQLMISPNPASKSFTVSELKEVENTDELEVRVLREDGRLIKSYQTQAREITVEDLNLDTGKYIVEIANRATGKRETRKLVITK